MSACSFSTLMLNLVLTFGIPPEFRGGGFLYQLTTVCVFFPSFIDCPCPPIRGLVTVGNMPSRRQLCGKCRDRVVGLLDTVSYARSLRNLLVSGNECGRVFPAGVGPGSPSRDAANWLSSRFSLSVETRRRYGWLRMMVFPGARLFPSPNLVPFGRVAARERQGALSRRVW